MSPEKRKIRSSTNIIANTCAGAITTVVAYSRCHPTFVSFLPSNLGGCQPRHWLISFCQTLYKCQLILVGFGFIRISPSVLGTYT